MLYCLCLIQFCLFIPFCYLSFFSFFTFFTSICRSQTKGTTSFGKRHTKTHTACRRCGKVSFHRQKKQCASCAYPEAKIRHFEWGQKAKRRRTTGTGRTQHLKDLPRRFKNGFREGSVAKSLKAK